MFSKSKQNSRVLDTSKQQVVSITYEDIGLFPRSFNRVFDRFFKQLFFDVENLVIQEYRFYRYLFLTTVKCLFILIFVPLGINFLAKNYFIHPVTEYYWNTHNHEIFLNSYQQKQAFREFKNFEEKIYFESLLLSENQLLFEGSYTLDEPLENNLLDGDKNHPLNFSFQKNKQPDSAQNSNVQNSVSNVLKNTENLIFQIDVSQEQKIKNNQQIQTQQSSLDFSALFRNSLQKRLQTKMLELANHYNEESIEAVTNFFADIVSFASLCFLLVRLEIQINITKSFLLEVFFGLDDSKKSLLILFVTDLLVGYHSPNIWELFFQTLFDHYGLPESQTTIFLLVATLPVLLDVLFKYLIFRHLNRASPATVATYHAMIE
uniref:chloroplast envelope membrane protein n=1 Tax=Coelastrum microporum TaxID=55409 RepID=UPI00226CA37B|nr:chloroplast envelope membrane protein [Coelastrum microporum]UWM13084.1 chloroplast envelope membrane protein [Coelastrum microporum]